MLAGGAAWALAAVCAAGAAPAAAASGAASVAGVFCRKVCVVSRKRVRSTFFFFFGVGGVYEE
jgi:hypothetical protein